MDCCWTRQAEADCKPFNENRHLAEVVPVTVIMDYAQLI